MESAIEKLYELLREISLNHPGAPLGVKKLSVDIGCSMAYVSQNLKMAKICDYVDMDIEGNYFVKKIPKSKKLFITKIAAENKKYRARVRGTGTPRGKRIVVPENFEISEENIVPVIQKIIEENKLLESKVEKYKRYIKKMREKGGVEVKRKKRKRGVVMSEDISEEEMVD